MTDRDSHDRKIASADHAGPDPDDDVGYRRPTRHGQFPPGKSGNRCGRPAGSRNRKTVVKEVALEMHWVDEDGKRVRRPAIELVLGVIRNKALAGDPRGNRTLHDLIEKFAPEATGEAAGLLVVPAEMTPEEWMADQMERNKLRKPPPGIDDI